MVIRVPHDLVVFLFGERLAPYFNEICAAITFIGLFIYLLTPRKTRKIIRQKKDTRPIYVDIDEKGRISYEGHSKESKKKEHTTENKWYASGWYFDEKLGKWAPPDYRHVEIDANDPVYQAWKAEWKATKDKKKNEHPEE